MIAFLWFVGGLTAGIVLTIAAAVIYRLKYTAAEDEEWRSWRP